MVERKVISVSEIMQEKLYIARPLKTIQESYDSVRINIVLDDIGAKGLFGGVATSLILVTLLCAENDWTLRIITRYNSCNLKDYYDFMKKQDIAVPKRVESYSDEMRDCDEVNFALTVSDKDVFMATSWWSAKSILESNITNRIMYIIQEEETFFYPYSDEHLWCTQIMNSDKIDFIVNSKLLFDYLKVHGYTTLVENALWFEPAFSRALYYASDDSFEKKLGEKRKLFFYGRPLNPRNLFYFGLECLDEAILRGIIDTDIWEIYMAGFDTKAVQFTNGYISIMNGRMEWEKYAEFARSVDVSFSLMYTPHPSYPPLDMLCSGAVALTNEFENKRDLTYSENMITVPLEKEALLNGLEQAMHLAMQKDVRKRNYENNKINYDWKISFAEIIPILQERIKEGRYV